MTLKNLQLEGTMRDAVSRKLLDTAKGTRMGRELESFFLRMGPKAADHAFSTPVVSAIVAELNMIYDLLERENDSVEQKKQLRGKYERYIATFERLLSGNMPEAEARDGIRELETRSAKGTSEDFTKHVDFYRIGGAPGKTARYIEVLDKLKAVDEETVKCDTPEEHQTVIFARAAAGETEAAIRQYGEAMATAQEGLTAARATLDALNAEIVSIDTKSKDLDATIRGKILAEASENEIADLERENTALLDLLRDKTVEREDARTNAQRLESDIHCMTQRMEELNATYNDRMQDVTSAIMYLEQRRAELVEKKLQLTREKVKLVPLVEAEMIIGRSREKIEEVDEEIRKSELIISEQTISAQKHEAELLDEVGKVADKVAAKLTEAATKVLALAGGAPLLVGQCIGALETAVEQLGLVSGELVGRAETVLRRFFDGNLLSQVQGVITDGMGITGKTDISLAEAVNAIVTDTVRRAVQATEAKLVGKLGDLHVEVQVLKRQLGLDADDSAAATGSNGTGPAGSA